MPKKEELEQHIKELSRHADELRDEVALVMAFPCLPPSPPSPLPHSGLRTCSGTEKTSIERASSSQRSDKRL